MTKTRIIRGGLLIATAVLVFASCGSKKGGDDRDRAVTVLVDRARKGSLERYLDLNARLVGRSEVQVYADVSGKVDRIVRFEGERVNKGDAIVYIDRSQVGLNYVLAPVKSPIAGSVTAVHVLPGQNVVPGAVPIASVGNISEIDALINVPESEVDRVAVGQRVLLSVPAYPGRVFNASVYRKDFSIDPQSHTLLVRAKVDNRTRELLPGMYADASLLTASASNVIVLMNTALVRGDGADYVYGIGELKTNLGARRTNAVLSVARLKPVKILFEYRDRVAVASGLSDGEEFVSYGREFLKDGALINPVRETAVTNGEPAK